MTESFARHAWTDARLLKHSCDFLKEKKISKSISTMTILLSILVLINTSTYADYASKVLETFEGPHNKNTPVFLAKPNWQIKYHALEPDRHFSIVVHGENGEYIDLAANEIGPKEGLYFQARGGKYYLEVTAVGKLQHPTRSRSLEGFLDSVGEGK